MPNVDRPVRILVAEDNAALRAVLAIMLSQDGLETHFAVDGAQAVEASGIAAYDLVLMDLHMPQMDGLAATRAIRAGGGPNAATPILALTASAEPEAVAACRAAGMTAHLTKPMTPAALYAAISSALAEAMPDASTQHAQALGSRRP